MIKANNFNKDSILGLGPFKQNCENKNFLPKSSFASFIYLPRLLVESQQ